MKYMTIHQRLRAARYELECQYAMRHMEAALRLSQRLDILIHHILLLRQPRFSRRALRSTAPRKTEDSQIPMRHVC